MEITQKLVQSLFNYKDGNLYWKKINVKNQRKIGDQAGSFNKSNGRYHVSINQKIYRLHRIIFLYHHGYLPKMIDHIDRDPSNNLIENLRPTTKIQNGMNRESQKNSTSKYKGVSWDKSRNKWRSTISINKKQKYLGRFDNELDAAIAYNEKAIELFTDFVYLNKIEDIK